MTTRHLLDPELAFLADSFPRIVLSAEILPALRTQFAAGLAEAQGDAQVSFTQRHIPGPSGAPDVRLCLYTPTAKASAKRPALLHIHGGGYVIGRPEISHAQLMDRAGSLGCVVVSVDYRLAPETPYPGPLEDCYRALAWLNEEADALGVDRKRIAVVGESAGGGLATGLTLLVRDRGEFSLCLQVLEAPMLDDRTARSRPGPPGTGEFMWTTGSNAFAWGSYLGPLAETADVPPYAAAARAASLAGLPPACIGVGSLDLFSEEDIAYAGRLEATGVPAELHVYEGACHGFILAPEAGVSKAWMSASNAALRRAFG